MAKLTIGLTNMNKKSKKITINRPIAHTGDEVFAAQPLLVPACDLLEIYNLQYVKFLYYCFHLSRGGGGLDKPFFS